MKSFPNLTLLSTQPTIHPTAIVEDGVQLGCGVKVGPFCIVRAPVTLHDNVELKSHVIIEGCTTIGAGTIVHPFAVLGAATPDRKYHGESSQLIIGERNVIREYVTMHPGTAVDKNKTVVGNDNLIMERVHIAHDCVIGNNVTLVNSVGLSGHVIVEDNVTIGGMTGVTQRVRVGRGAFVGGHCKVEKDVVPNSVVRGDDAYLNGINLIGLKRRDYSEVDIKEMQRAYNKLFAASGTLAERMLTVEHEHGTNVLVQELLNFIKTREMGLTLPPSN